MLSQNYAKELIENREVLKKIIACVKFLARQGLPLRGDGDEKDVNFLQFLKFQEEQDDVIHSWLQKKTNKYYTSHEIQNEILNIMVISVLRNISDVLQRSPFLTIMIDETTDIISNKEQVVVVFRRVDEDFEVHEEFIGLYEVMSIDAATLTSVIKDAMTRSNLPFAKLRGQCCNGCSTMSGLKTGVAKRISDEEPRAVFTHCYGHSLNLAASDTIKKSSMLRNALDTTHEITKLIKFSPRRNAILNQFKV